MRNDKITEFLTVLIFAMAVGGAAMLTILYLEGILRAVALIVIIAATIGSWSYLRKRFGRYD
ncbi:MAG: hypothetical protein K6T99_08415 [Armatimonadetes bacterium]|nr:hypothetical protein [Armatimonadota bacterium]